MGPLWSARVGEATTVVETTKERYYEADIHSIAGEIALMSPESDATKAEVYFEHALASRDHLAAAVRRQRSRICDPFVGVRLCGVP